MSGPKVDGDGGVVAEADAVIVDGLPATHGDVVGERRRDADVVAEVVRTQHASSDDVDRWRRVGADIETAFERSLRRLKKAGTVAGKDRLVLIE